MFEIGQTTPPTRKPSRLSTFQEYRHNEGTENETYINRDLLLETGRMPMFRISEQLPPTPREVHPCTGKLSEKVLCVGNAAYPNNAN